MLFRNCAGGIVFCNDQVLLIKNDKGDWAMPKGVVHEGDALHAVALARVMAEAGVSAEVLLSAGETCYEFFSFSRKRPVCNRIQWYIMQTGSVQCTPNRWEDIHDAGFFDHDDALTRITYTQDRSLLAVAYKAYRQLRQNG